MIENVVKMQLPLDRLADKIRDAISRREEGWVDATLDLIRYLKEARTQLPVDTAFGRWCNEQFPNLGKEERAAALRMSVDLTLAREVLEKTHYRSIRNVEEKEFRPRISADANPAPPKPRRGRPSRSRRIPPDKEQIVEEQVRQGKTAHEAAEAAGINKRTAEVTARVARERMEAEARVRAEVDAKQAALDAKAREEALDVQAEAVVNAAPEAKRMSMREALDRLKAKLERQFSKKLKDAVEQAKHAIRKEAWDELDAWKVREFTSVMDDLQIVRSIHKFGHQKPFTHAVYTNIMRCLHTDTYAAYGLPDDLRGRLNEAFQAFTAAKHVIAQPKPDPAMVRRLEEMDRIFRQRRDEINAARAAKAKRPS